jgi:hypothetical protein
MLTSSSTATTTTAAASALLQAPEFANRPHEIVLDTITIGHAEADRQLRQDFAVARQNTGRTSGSVKHTRSVQRRFRG